jgi:hypothetical protein
MMSNKRPVLEWLDALERGDVEATDRYIAETFIDRTPGNGAGTLMCDHADTSRSDALGHRGGGVPRNVRRGTPLVHRV